MASIPKPQTKLFQWYKMHYGSVYEHAKKAANERKMMQQVAKKENKNN